MINTVIMMMIFLTKVKITFPEQSLQDMPPVPRHLWQALTTPVCGTVTTLTWELTINFGFYFIYVVHASDQKTDKNITNIILIITMITSSLNIFAGGSSMSHGRGAPPRPGPSTSPPWSELIIMPYRTRCDKKNLVRSISPAGFSFLRERLQLIVVSRHIVHTWVDHNRDAVSRFLIDKWWTWLICNGRSWWEWYDDHIRIMCVMLYFRDARGGAFRPRGGAGQKSA